MKAKKAEVDPHPMAGSVDELGEIERVLAPFRQRIARAEALRKLIRDHHAADPGAATFLIEGKRFTVSLGSKARAATVDNRTLCTLIGMGEFERISAVTLKKLETEVPAEFVGSVVSYSLTGPRPLQIFPRTNHHLPPARP